MTKVNVADLFSQAKLLGLAKLYIYAVQSGLEDIGSSSIDSSFTSAVQEIKLVLASKAGVHPSNAGTASLWESIGDPSATFYFSGYRHVDGAKRIFVPTALFLEILSDHLDHLTNETKTKIDILSHAINPSLFKLIHKN